MSRLATFSRRLVLPALAIALFAVPAMAGELIAHDPPHPLSIGVGSSSSAGGGSGGGGNQEIMNDDYYHTPKATDPGVKVNVLTAHDKPLDTSSYIAKDPGHKLNVLTASDTPRHQKLWNPVRDMGAEKTKGLGAAAKYAYDQAHPPLPYCAQNGDTNCQIPYCGEAPSDIACEPDGLENSPSCADWFLFHKYCPADD